MPRAVHHEVREALLQRLMLLPLESRLPSDRDLAREYNVAFLTINRVMRDLERDGFVVRRARQGTFLASHTRTVTNSTGAGAGGDEGELLVVYPNYFSYHYWRHVRLAEELALKHRLRLLECRLSPGSGYERAVAVAAGANRLRGALVLPVPESLTRENLAALDGLGRPVVLLSTTFDVEAWTHLRSVDVDWKAAGRLLAGELLKAGHRRIAYLNHEPDRPTLLVQGMKQALRDHGLRGSDLITLLGDTHAWQDSREAGYRLTLRLLDEGRATAAHCDSVAGARGALRALWERGLRAPDDLALTATGMQSGDEDYLTPALSTVDADWDAEMRWAVAAVLADDRAAPRSHIVPATWRARASVAAPAAATS